MDQPGRKPIIALIFHPYHLFSSLILETMPFSGMEANGSPIITSPKRKLKVFYPSTRWLAR